MWDITRVFYYKYINQGSKTELENLYSQDCIVCNLIFYHSDNKCGMYIICLTLLGQYLDNCGNEYMVILLPKILKETVEYNIQNGKAYSRKKIIGLWNYKLF